MEYRKIQGKLPSSTVEDTCTVNLLKDDIKMEYRKQQDKLEQFSY